MLVKLIGTGFGMYVGQFYNLVDFMVIIVTTGDLVYNAVYYPSIMLDTPTFKAFRVFRLLTLVVLGISTFVASWCACTK